MPALVLHGPGNLALRDIPTWDIAAYGDPDLVLIRVEACGVCGSDFRYYAGENPWAQHTLGRFVPNAPNIVLGHEYAGTVVAVQTEANRPLLGQRVAPICSKVCGRCADCRAGRTRLCADTVHMGHGQGWGERDFYPGAYARYALAWGSSCFPVPENLLSEEAAMLDILAVALHVAERGDIQPGRPVLMVGAGPAGNAVAQAALNLGASAAVLIDRSDAALDIARAQGIGTVLDDRVLTDDEWQAIASVIAPDGFGSVFDSVGTAASFARAVNAMGRASTLVNMAVHDSETNFNWMALSGERRIATSCNFEVGDYPRALAWLASGRFRVREWLTPTTLSAIPETFAAHHRDPEAKTAMKLVIDPSR